MPSDDVTLEASDDSILVQIRDSAQCGDDEHLKSIEESVPSQRKWFSLIGQPGDDGRTSVHMAIANDSVDTIKALLAPIPAEQRCFLLEKKDYKGVAPVHLAGPHTLKWIKNNVDYEKWYRLLVLRSGEDGANLLYHAVAEGKVEIVKYVILSLSNDDMSDLLMAVSGTNDSAMQHLQRDEWSNDIDQILVELPPNKAETLRRLREPADVKPKTTCQVPATSFSRDESSMFNDEFQEEYLCLAEDDSTPIMQCFEQVVSQLEQKFESKLGDAIKAMKETLQMQQKEELSKVYESIQHLQNENTNLLKAYEDCRRECGDLQTANNSLQEAYNELQLKQQLEGLKTDFANQFNKQEHIIDSLETQLDAANKHLERLEGATEQSSFHLAQEQNTSSLSQLCQIYEQRHNDQQRLNETLHRSIVEMKSTLPHLPIIHQHASDPVKDFVHEDLILIHQNKIARLSNGQETLFLLVGNNLKELTELKEDVYLCLQTSTQSTT